ncbi:MAG TPA: hypothetical protein VF174_14850 [Micromonosporaceae bacterium]
MHHDEPTTAKDRAEVVGDARPEQGHRHPVRGHRLLRRSRWSAATLAALGALAFFASLVSEWQRTVIRVDVPEFAHEQTLAIGIAELVGWSSAYLLSVLMVTVCVALVLFGPAAGREHVRVAGLAASGVLAGVLTAIVFYLHKHTAVVQQPLLLPWDEQLELLLGRGVSVAFVSVGAYALALLLAPSARSPERVGVRDEENPAHAGSDRRPPPTQASDTEATSDPFDLTVGPSTPFVPFQPKG